MGQGEGGGGKRSPKQVRGLFSLQPSPCLHHADQQTGTPLSVGLEVSTHLYGGEGWGEGWERGGAGRDRGNGGEMVGWGRWNGKGCVFS